MLKLVALIFILFFSAPSFADGVCVNLFEIQASQATQKNKLPPVLPQRQTIENLAARLEKLLENSKSPEEFLKSRNQMQVPEMKDVLLKTISSLKEIQKNLELELSDKNSFYNQSSFFKNNIDYVLQKMNVHIDAGTVFLQKKNYSYLDLHFYFYKSSFYLIFLPTKVLHAPGRDATQDQSQLEIATHAVFSFNHTIEKTNSNIERAVMIERSIGAKRSIRGRDQDSKPFKEIYTSWTNYLDTLKTPFLTSFYTFGIVPMPNLNHQTAHKIKLFSLSNKLENFDGFENKLPRETTEHDIDHFNISVEYYIEKVFSPNLSFREQILLVSQISRSLKLIFNAIEKEKDPKIEMYLQKFFFKQTHEDGVDMNLINNPKAAVKNLRIEADPFAPHPFASLHSEIKFFLELENQPYSEEIYRKAVQEFESILISVSANSRSN